MGLTYGGVFMFMTRSQQKKQDIWTSHSDFSISGTSKTESFPFIIMTSTKW